MFEGANIWNAANTFAKQPAYLFTVVYISRNCQDFVGQVIREHGQLRVQPELEFFVLSFTMNRLDINEKLIQRIQLLLLTASKIAWLGPLWKRRFFSIETKLYQPHA